MISADVHDLMAAAQARRAMLRRRLLAKSVRFEESWRRAKLPALSEDTDLDALIAKVDASPGEFPRMVRRRARELHDAMEKLKQEVGKR